MPVFDHTQEEAKHYDTMLKWLRILQKERCKNHVGVDGSHITFNLPTDIDWRKSSLFARLREGKDPLPEPPPRAYSYPWYEVVEEDKVHERNELYLITKQDAHHPVVPLAIINQCRYDSVQEIGPDEYIVTYNCYKFRIWKASDDPAMASFCWNMQRIEWNKQS